MEMLRLKPRQYFLIPASVTNSNSLMVTLTLPLQLLSLNALHAVEELPLRALHLRDTHPPLLALPSSWVFSQGASRTTSCQSRQPRVGGQVLAARAEVEA